MTCGAAGCGQSAQAVSVAEHGALGRQTARALRGALVLIVTVAVHWMLMPQIGLAQTAISAAYEGPTDRYPHGALGDEIEYTTLAVTLSDGQILRATWDRPVVFEDSAPRLVDIDGDGSPEVLTVEAHEDFGARASFWRVLPDRLEPVASVPWIGQRFRWLAPLGVADLDGDGTLELAYIDRPHLARTLRIWRIAVSAPDTVELTQIASAPGLTNHRLRDPRIPGGIRDCGTGPEIITADADWSRVMATTLNPDGTLVSRSLGLWSAGALDLALAC